MHQFQKISDFDYELSLLKKHVPDLFEYYGTVLDVGCNDGSFGMALKQKGINYIGVEPNVEAANTGIKAGLNIINRMFEFNGCLENMMNIKLVSFRECLYYIPNIEETFLLLDKILLPNGYVYIKSVNASSVYFSTTKTPASRAGEGFTRLYTRKETESLLVEHGYDVVYSGYYPHNVFSTVGFQGCDIAVFKMLGRAIRPITEWLDVADRYIVIAKKKN